MSATVTRLLPAVPVARMAPWQTGSGSLQGSLALDVRGPLGMPEVRLAESTDGSPIELHAYEARMWAARFTQAVHETIGGERPVTQLVRWTSKRVYEDLARRVHLVGLARPHGRARAIRPQVRNVRVAVLDHHHAEAAVVVGHGERSRCAALRMERDPKDGRWVCVALELG